MATKSGAMTEQDFVLREVFNIFMKGFDTLIKVNDEVGSELLDLDEFLSYRLNDKYSIVIDYDTFEYDIVYTLNGDMYIKEFMNKKASVLFDFLSNFSVEEIIQATRELENKIREIEETTGYYFYNIKRWIIE